MNTRLESEKAYQLARSQAGENARAARDQVVLRNDLSATAFALVSAQASVGLASAQVPVDPKSSSLSAQVKRAVGELFEQHLVAWNTNKGWLYTPEPRNPHTKRRLTGDLFLTEKAILDYGDDLYRIYFIANDFDRGDLRQSTYHQPQWRATMSAQVAPSAKVAPPLLSPSARRVR